MNYEAIHDMVFLNPRLLELVRRNLVSGHVAPQGELQVYQWRCLYCADLMPMDRFRCVGCGAPKQDYG